MSRSLTRTFAASPIRISNDARTRTSAWARSSRCPARFAASPVSVRHAGSPPRRGQLRSDAPALPVREGSIPWCGRDSCVAATRRCMVLGATVQPPIAQITSAAWSLLLARYPVARSSSRACSSGVEDRRSVCWRCGPQTGSRNARMAEAYTIRVLGPGQMERRSAIGRLSMHRSRGSAFKSSSIAVWK